MSPQASRGRTATGRSCPPNLWRGPGQPGPCSWLPPARVGAGHQQGTDHDEPLGAVSVDEHPTGTCSAAYGSSCTIEKKPRVAAVMPKPGERAGSRNAERAAVPDGDHGSEVPTVGTNQAVRRPSTRPPRRSNLDGLAIRIQDSSPRSHRSVAASGELPVRSTGRTAREVLVRPISSMGAASVTAEARERPAGLRPRRMRRRFQLLGQQAETGGHLTRPAHLPVARRPP
jgi:hypothetical protein